MKKITSLLLTAILLATMLFVFALPASADEPLALAGFEDGTGTKENPYQIATKEQLENLASLVNQDITCENIYFILTNDIDGVTAVIGGKQNSFNGHFDGNGHTVTLQMGYSGDYHGLFSYIIRAEVKNLTTAGNVGGSYYIGGVCATNLSSRIINCCNTANVSGTNYVGGICGKNSNGTVANCCNISQIKAAKNDGGAICGSNEGRITNCYHDSDACGGRTVGASNSPINSYAFPHEQMVAASGSKLNTGIADNKPLVDLLNSYVDENPIESLLSWKVENGKVLHVTEESSTGSMLSNGNIWIIVAVAVVVIAGVAALVIVKKKKKPAVAEGENTDEE